MEYRSQRAERLVATLGLLLGLVATGCTFNPAGFSTTGECGDGVVDRDEACDRSDLAGASCDSLGYGTGTLSCASNCAFDTSGCSDAPVCGDGTVAPSEECDDGNNVDCDGCSADCVPEGCGDSDCRGFCIEENRSGNPPSGYCVTECNISASVCPGDGVCSAIVGAEVGDLALCLDGCHNGGDCDRFGYGCENNPTGNGGDVCWYE